MKYDNLRAFEKHLEGASPNNFSNVYLVLVKDSGERRAAVDLLVKHLLANEKHPEWVLKSFSGDAPGSALVSELNTFSFLSKRQVVVVHDADALKKDTQAAIEQFYVQGNRSLTLVLAATTLNRSTNFYKKGEKAGVVLELAEMKPWEKEKVWTEWLVTQATTLGKKFPYSVAQALVKQMSGEFAELKSELDKLAAYTGDRQEITHEDLAAICCHTPTETIWQLGEALFKRDCQSALRISKGLNQAGAPFLTFVRQVRSQFQTEFQICSILINGGGPAEIMNAFPYMKGAILDRHRQSAMAYGFDRFKQAMICLDEIELLSKNGVDDMELLNELLMVKLTS